ncbi:MAG TPA: Na+/H+ antiporter [Steroidobacteraceae bacterium]|nr:Na+/H+ antiporter [Steroidobacteraceae bacterium]
MIQTLQLLVVLLAVIAGVEALAIRLQIPSAILLVLTGVVLALIPGLPAVSLAPELVLLVILPLFIYQASFSMSWKDFRANLGSISLLAVGCVVFTTVLVAAACHLWLKLSWPVGFTVGAIVSPPDAVAPLSIARRLQIPRRILTILEGEGLANDATALVLYRFAVVAVSAGSISIAHASALFSLIIVGEVLWGIAVGWVMLHLRHWARDTHIEVTLSLLTPFVAFWPPQHLGGSGVLATVACGLYVSWNGQRLISSATRLQGVFFWDFLIYVVEGLVFLVTGLQARTVIGGIAGYSTSELAIAAALVSVVVIGARFAWIFPAAYLAVLGHQPDGAGEERISWQRAFTLAFTGIRGVVSLAAALSLPVLLDNGAPFPARNFILYLTFAVILVTLVGQGLAFARVVTWLGLAHAGRRERFRDRAVEFKARRAAIEAALAKLEDMTRADKLAEEVLAPVRRLYRERLRHVEHRGDGDASHSALMHDRDAVEYRLIATEREHINATYRNGELKDDARRRIEREFDLREAHLASVGGSEPSVRD